MERRFINFRNYFINIEAISCAEMTENGGMTISMMGRDSPIRLSVNEGSEFRQILGRVSLQLREKEATP
jgi:hypothetical protein